MTGRDSYEFYKWKIEHRNDATFQAQLKARYDEQLRVLGFRGTRRLTLRESQQLYENVVQNLKRLELCGIGGSEDRRITRPRRVRPIQAQDRTRPQALGRLRARGPPGDRRPFVAGPIHLSHSNNARSPGGRMSRGTIRGPVPDRRGRLNHRAAVARTKAVRRALDAEAPPGQICMRPRDRASTIVKTGPPGGVLLGRALEGIGPPPIRTPGAAFGPTGRIGRQPRGTDENRAASPSAIVGWVRTASRSAV